MCEQEHNHVHEHEEEESKNLPLKILLALLVLLAALLLKVPNYVEFILFSAAYLIAGGDVLFRALKNILKGQIFDENFLMSIATIGAFAIKEYPEAVMVMVLYQIGEYFQDKAVDKTRDSIAELMDIRPEWANVEQNGELIKVKPVTVKIDDVITVKAGERIPLDGVVIDGEAVVDTSALTGESVPRKLTVGDSAISGCINTNGVLKIRVGKLFTDSTVSKILELVESTSERKTITENFITKFARYYTPVVVVLAVLLAIIPPIFFGGEFNTWFLRALTFLVISCPCAIVISVPLGFFAGIGGASGVGILVKGSNCLEGLSRIDSVVFDKTGTLTKGVFKVCKIVPQNGISESEILKFASYAEYYSNHPIANSIKTAYKEVINAEDILNVEEIAGNGICANIKGVKILVGNKSLMDKFNIKYQTINDFGTVVYVAKYDIYLGYIIISDEIKEQAKTAIQEIRKLGIRTVMLTGDNSATAQNVSEILNIDEYHAQLLPVDKVNKLEEIIQHKDKNKNVVFVGDGINDAPVLTRADIGISMGALGSDAAIEASDVVIMDDNIAKITLGIQIAKKTMTVVKQNIVFAIGIKVLFLVLGSLGFMTMWGAVFADVGVTLIAVCNSLRALRSPVKS